MPPSSFRASGAKPELQLSHNVLDVRQFWRAITALAFQRHIDRKVALTRTYLSVKKHDSAAGIECLVLVHLIKCGEKDLAYLAREPHDGVGETLCGFCMAIMPLIMGLSGCKQAHCRDVMAVAQGGCSILIPALEVLPFHHGNTRTLLIPPYKVAKGLESLCWAVCRQLAVDLQQDP